MTSIDPAVQGDDRRRFEACFRAHHADVLAFAIRRQPDRQAAEDATAETFAIAWRRRGLLPDPALPWLYGIALRVLANQRRSGARRRRLEERLAGERSAHGGGDPTDALARRDAFAAALAALGGDDREVLRLIAWEGLDPPDAAKVLGCSHGALRVRLHRARRRLRKQLAAAGHSTDERRDFGDQATEETR